MGNCENSEDMGKMLVRYIQGGASFLVDRNVREQQHRTGDSLTTRILNLVRHRMREYTSRFLRVQNR